VTEKELYLGTPEMRRALPSMTREELAAIKDGDNIYLRDANDRVMWAKVGPCTQQEITLQLLSFETSSFSFSRETGKGSRQWPTIAPESYVFIKDPISKRRGKRRGKRLRAVLATVETTPAAAAKAAAGPTYEDFVKWFNEDRLVEAGIPVEGRVTVGRGTL
jgi:hypothetical protein